MLAIPTIKGVKSPSERFAGAKETYTIEALMQNGWALQSGTSHFLGQNFARAFDVQFQTESGTRQLVWATSWGVSTRLVGAMIMTHSDDAGLVLPPRVAPFQIVLVPIKGKSKNKEDELVNENVLSRVRSLAKALKAARIRVHVDDREYVRPGAKYFEWERKGVPIRLEIGPRDLTGVGTAVIAIRHSGDKRKIDTGEASSFVKSIQESLSGIHDSMLETARVRLAAKTVHVTSYLDMKDLLNIKATRRVGCIKDSGEDNNEEEIDGVVNDNVGFFKVFWKCDSANEAAIKADCKATIRCYPLADNEVPPAQGIKCFYSGEQASHVAIFARAF